MYLKHKEIRCRDSYRLTGRSGLSFFIVGIYPQAKYGNPPIYFCVLLCYTDFGLWERT